MQVVSQRHIKKINKKTLNKLQKHNNHKNIPYYYFPFKIKQKNQELKLTLGDSSPYDIFNSIRNRIYRESNKNSFEKYFYQEFAPIVRELEYAIQLAIRDHKFYIWFVSRPFEHIFFPKKCHNFFLNEPNIISFCFYSLKDRLKWKLIEFRKMEMNNMNDIEHLYNLLSQHPSRSISILEECKKRGRQESKIRNRNRHT